MIEEESAMSQTYRVSGMTCQGCVNAVTNAIKAAAPGAGVAVDLAGGTVTVDHLDDEAVLRQAVEEAGFEFGGSAAG
jgi:copper chaperone